MNGVLEPPIPKVPMMANSKGRTPVGKQINFRAPPDLQSQLEETAEALGLDVSALVRLVLTENMHAYVARATEVRERNKANRRKQPKPLADEVRKLGQDVVE